MKRTYIDKPLALLVASLLIGGSLIFASAAFGLLGRGEQGVSSVVTNHLLLGIGAGLIAMIITISVDYRMWRKFAPYIFATAVVVTLGVFIPHIGLSHGGGRRWIVIFGTSFQPSEALKLGTIVMTSAYFAAMRNKISLPLYGLGGFLAIVALPTLILLLQPDLGTLGVILFSSLSVFWIAGARIRDIAALALLALIALAMLAYVKPYVRDRVQTFLNPTNGAQEESYQIHQSLIAIGSGQLTGRGFGQGIQKFTYLPEPMGDSIFAVAGEELGFVGATGIIILFTLFALRGYQIATRTAEPFGKYLATGITTYLAIEAFINIASMLGVAPLTGIPLTFVSQGGSAMMVSLASAGILLGISRKKHV